MFQSDPSIQPTPFAPAGTPYACGGGPRFAPAAFDAYGKAAWPGRFGYGQGVSPMFSTPGPDTRGYDPFAVEQLTPPGQAGVIANGGYTGGGGVTPAGTPIAAPAPAAGATVGASGAVCSRFGVPLPRWSPGPVYSSRTGAYDIASSDGEGLGEFTKGLLWIGAGLVLVSVLGDLGGRGA